MKKRLILLDIDQTLFFCDTFVELMKYFVTLHPSRLSVLPELAAGAIGYFAGTAGDTALKEKALKIFAGESLERLRRISGIIIERAFRHKLNRSLYENIKALRAGGMYYLVVISASPSFYIDMIGEEIGADKTIATVVEFDENGRLVPRISGRNCKAFEKVERLKKEVDLSEFDLEESYAFSDSHTDKPIFDIVGHPVAVNPDSKLVALAANDARYRHFGKYGN